MKNKLFRTVLILTAFSLFSCITFEAFHHSHELTCQDESCEICLVLQIVRNTIRLSGSKPFITFIQTILFFEFILACFTGVFKSITPVTQKIKLTT